MADVGVVERGNRTGFAGKALGELRIGHFDRDIPIQTRVSGAVHLAHASGTDGRKDLVRAEFVAYRKGHGRSSVQFSRPGAECAWITAHPEAIWFSNAVQ